MDTQLETQIKKLPSNILERISAPGFAQTLDSIVKKYSLDQEDEMAVKEEVYSLIIGVYDPLLFIENIQLASLLDDNESEKLATELSETLIDPIADELSEYWINEIAGDLPDESDIDLESLVKIPEESVTAQNNSEARDQALKRVSDPYRENPPVAATPVVELASPDTSVLSAPAHRPLKTQMISDVDIASAKKALSDPYREQF